MVMVMDEKVHYHDHYLNFSSEAFRCQEKIFMSPKHNPVSIPESVVLIQAFTHPDNTDKLLILPSHTSHQLRVTAQCNCSRRSTIYIDIFW